MRMDKFDFDLKNIVDNDFLYYEKLIKKLKRTVFPDFNVVNGPIGTGLCAEFTEYTVVWWTVFLRNGPDVGDLFIKAHQAVPGSCTPHDIKIMELLLPKMESMLSKVQARIDEGEIIIVITSLTFSFRVFSTNNSNNTNSTDNIKSPKSDIDMDGQSLRLLQG